MIATIATTQNLMRATHSPSANPSPAPAEPPAPQDIYPDDIGPMRLQAAKSKMNAFGLLSVGCFTGAGVCLIPGLGVAVTAGLAVWVASLGLLGAGILHHKGVQIDKRADELWPVALSNYYRGDR